MRLDRQLARAGGRDLVVVRRRAPDEERRPLVVNVHCVVARRRVEAQRQRVLELKELRQEEAIASRTRRGAHAAMRGLVVPVPTAGAVDDRPGMAHDAQGEPTMEDTAPEGVPMGRGWCYLALVGAIWVWLVFLWK